DLPWDALRELDAAYRFRALDGSAPYRGRGVRIPLFEEVLESFPRERLNVECKAAPAAAPLRRMIERHGATHRVLIAAHRERERAGARGYAGPWGAASGQVALVRALGARRAPAADIIQVPERWHG